MRLEHEQLAFLAGLAGSTQGKLFKQVMEGKLAEVDKQLRRLSGDDVLRAQGKAQALEDLIGILDNAQASLNRSQASRSQGTRVVASS